MNTLFQDQWRACLIESLKVLIKENRNIEGIKEAMLKAGFKSSEIQSYFVSETMTTATQSNIETAASFTEFPDACS